MQPNLRTKVQVYDEETQNLLGEADLLWSLEVKPEYGAAGVKLHLNPVILPQTLTLDDGREIVVDKIQAYFPVDAAPEQLARALVNREESALLLTPFDLWVGPNPTAEGLQGAVWFTSTL